MSAARNDPLTAEYGKSIVFDYSYRHFYGDGYGKDCRILHLKEDSREEQAEMLLLGNLLFLLRTAAHLSGTDERLL